MSVGSENKLSDITSVGSCVNLKSLSITSTNMVSDIAPISNLINLTSLSLNNNNITDITALSGLTSLTFLNLSNNSIIDITPLSKCTSLTSLGLSNNNITDITPTSKCINLKTLDLRGNVGIDGNRENYTSEEIAKLDKIGEILDRNGTIYVDLDKLGLFTNYKTLDLSNQNMTNLLYLKGLTNLTSLTLSNNQITLEDEESRDILSSMTKLTTLNLSNNNLTNISAINSLTNLTNLYLNGKNNNIDLSEIDDIINNVALSLSEGQGETFENCDSSKITKLRISQYSSGFDMSYISSLKNLNYLAIVTPNIENLNVISNISSLQTLILNSCNLHNNLPNVNFSGLTNLTDLRLSDNKLWSEDIENLKALRGNIGLTIDLTYNVIIDASALLELNEGTKIKLGQNPNLSESSKAKLKARFGTNVSF